MPNSSVPITPGSGANIAMNQVAGVDYQVIKVDWGGDGVSLPAVADSSGFLKVNLAASGATVVVNNPTAANLKVDASGTTVPISAASAIPVSAPVGTPVFVRLSDGSAPISTLPVSGTVTGNQGTAAAAASAWPIKISDGTNTAPLDSGNGNALKVSVVATVQPGTQGDKSAFTEGTTLISPIAGEYNTAPSNPSSGQVAAVQITQLRGLHVNLRKNDGTELGISTAPVRTDPTGATAQPVTGTVSIQLGGSAVATVATGVAKVALGDSGGTAISGSNPLAVTPVPNPSTFWSNHVAYTASQSAQAIRTPTSGKVTYVQGVIIVPTGAGTLEVFDGSASAANDLLNGTMPASGVFEIAFNPPRPLSAVNNILRYTTGSGATGDITAWGYEA